MTTVQTIWTLLQNGPIMGDGAMGTMLQEAGLTDGGAPELWNVEHPEKVRAIYQAYVDSGSQIISTNTFGGTSARLKFHNIGDRVYELNKAGAALACAVAHPAGVLVAGSMGPSGALIEPVGPLSMADATAMFAEQARGLIDGGVDLILIETMSHMNEVEAAVAGVRRISTEMPIAATMSFDTNYHTMMGVSPKQALETLSGWGVKIVGANCGNGPAEILAVMTQMAQHRTPGVYLMAQSNAGLPQYMEGEIRYDGTPAVMAEYATQMRNLGIDVIGACCGSTPLHLTAMHKALAQIKEQPIAGPPAVEEDAGLIESADSRANRAAARRRERRERTPRPM
ncbi:MAG: homocysteine S-methyltransferase family protein [Caldilineaceae bacterium]|nr:homocysteine S-methyltransferase family protein [Caldilineaceae bacterium]